MFDFLNLVQPVNSFSQNGTIRAPIPHPVVNSAKDLAKALGALQLGSVPWHLPKHLTDLAKTQNLAIVYRFDKATTRISGALDASREGAGSLDIWMDKRGVLPEFSQIRPSDKTALLAYFIREHAAALIQCTFTPSNPIPWVYVSWVKHESFELDEGGSPWCQGMVISLENLA